MSVSPGGLAQHTNAHQGSSAAAELASLRQMPVRSVITFFGRFYEEFVRVIRRIWLLTGWPKCYGNGQQQWVLVPAAA